MPSLRCLIVQLQKAALACATLLLLALGAASGARLEAGRGLAVQVLRQTIGFRLQQNLRRPVVLKSRGVVVDSVPSGAEEALADGAMVAGLPPGMPLALAGAPPRCEAVPILGVAGAFVPQRARASLPEARAPPVLAV